METVLKLALKIVNNAPIALSKTMNTVIQGMEVTLSEGLDLEQNEFSNLFITEDVKEGLSAFIEKRKPNFTSK